MTRAWLIIAAVSILFSACVPNRKLVYLQKNDVNKKKLPKDSVVRTYEPVSYSYKIQPNDALYIRFESLTPQEYDFFNNAEAGGSAVGGQNLQFRSDLVDPEGNINYPVVGKVKVAGLTIFEIQEKLQAIANEYLKSPTVKVRLVNFRFTLLGEVNQEGTVTLNNNRVTLPEAIGLSGGLAEMADRENVKLIRQRDGKTEVAYINLLDEKLMESPYYYVYQNDVLVVQPLRQRPFRKYFGQNVGIIISAASVILLFLNLTK